MEYRNLGRSGLQVSIVGLGCNNFGGRVPDEQQAASVVNRALDLGINFFDTADVYGGRGKSEEYLGRILQGKRHDVILATKFGATMGEGPYKSGASRRYIMDEVHASLRRLQTDYIDLYQQHVPDPSTPVEETLRALDDLVRDGEVRYIGHSNYSAAQAMEAAWVTKTEHLTPFITAQNPYSLLDRRIERELTGVCRRYGLSVLPYYPLAGGFLTGKHRPGQPAVAGTRLAGEQGAQWLHDKNYDVLVKLESIAAADGHTVLELAMSWLAQQPWVGSVISGATRPEQVEQNVNSVSWKLSPEEMAAVDEATLPLMS